MNDLHFPTLGIVPERGSGRECGRRAGRGTCVGVGVEGGGWCYCGVGYVWYFVWKRD